MSLTPLARKYRDTNRAHRTPQGDLIRKVIHLSGYSAAHIYNVASGRRKSRPVEAMLQDAADGRLS